MVFKYLGATQGSGYPLYLLLSVIPAKTGIYH